MAVTHESQKKVCYMYKCDSEFWLQVIYVSSEHLPLKRVTAGIFV